jgi:hypothetical protein
MTKNLATLDRRLRLLGGTALLLCAGFAPLDAALRLWALALPGAYVLGTAAFGNCLGYKLLGLSSCAVSPRRIEPER